MNKLADIQLGPEGGFTGFGPLGLEGGESAPVIFTKFISSTIGLMTIIAIIWFVILMIMGAIGIISSNYNRCYWFCCSCRCYFYCPINRTLNRDA